MSTTATLVTVFVSVFGAALFGMLLRRLLPEHHLGSETKETVKLAMGFVATMAALILGLLVASAKDSYDKQSTGVTQMAGKVIYLDRLLAMYGSETKDVRNIYRQLVEQVEQRMWGANSSGNTQLDPSALHTEEFFAAIHALKPASELQSTLKAQAVSLCLELGQVRWQEYEEAGTSASKPLITILIFWIAVLFASFGLFAPGNGTVVASLLLASLSVAGAIFLIMELRTPFAGFLQIPNTPFLDALTHLGK